MLPSVAVVHDQIVESCAIDFPLCLNLSVSGQVSNPRKGQKTSQPRGLGKVRRHQRRLLMVNRVGHIALRALNRVWLVEGGCSVQPTGFGRGEEILWFLGAEGLRVAFAHAEQQ